MVDITVNYKLRGKTPLPFQQYLKKKVARPAKRCEWMHNVKRCLFSCVIVWVVWLHNRHVNVHPSSEKPRVYCYCFRHMPRSLVKKKNISVRGLFWDWLSAPYTTCPSAFRKQAPRVAELMWNDKLEYRRASWGGSDVARFFEITEFSNIQKRQIFKGYSIHLNTVFKEINCINVTFGN